MQSEQWDLHLYNISHCKEQKKWTTWGLVQYHKIMRCTSASIFSSLSHGLEDQLKETLHITSLCFFAAWLLMHGCVLPPVWTVCCLRKCCFMFSLSLSISLCLPYSSFVQYRWRQWKPHRPGPQVSVSLIVTYSITEQVIYHSLPAGPPLPSLPPGWMILSELVTSTSILSPFVCYSVNWTAHYFNKALPLNSHH